MKDKRRAWTRGLKRRCIRGAKLTEYVESQPDKDDPAANGWVAVRRHCTSRLTSLKGQREDEVRSLSSLQTTQKRSVQIEGPTAPQQAIVEEEGDDARWVDMPDNRASSVLSPSNERGNKLHGNNTRMCSSPQQESRDELFVGMPPVPSSRQNFLGFAEPSSSGQNIRLGQNDSHAPSVDGNTGPDDDETFIPATPLEHYQLHLASPQTTNQLIGQHITTEGGNPSMIERDNPLMIGREEQLKKQARGRTRNIKLSRMGVGSNRIPLEFDQQGRVCSANATEFANNCGVILRENAPQQVSGWYEIPEPTRENIYRKCCERFEVPSSSKVKGHIMLSLAKKFRDFRSRIKKSHFDKFGTDEERLRNCPDQVRPDDWPYLVKHFNSTTFQGKRKRNISIPTNPQIYKRAGSSSFAKLKHMAETGVMADGYTMPERPTQCGARMFYILELQGQLEKEKERANIAEKRATTLAEEVEKYCRVAEAVRADLASVLEENAAIMQTVDAAIKEASLARAEATLFKKDNEDINRRLEIFQAGMSEAIRDINFSDSTTNLNNEGGAIRSLLDDYGWSGGVDKQWEPNMERQTQSFFPDNGKDNDGKKL